jgi:hypothetical protein
MRSRPVSGLTNSSLVAPLLLGGASAAFTLWQNLHVAALVDIAFIVNTAMRIAAGDVPYLDFPLVLAPLVFLTQGLLIKIFGPAYPVQIAYATILSGIATALAYAIVRRLLAEVVAAPRTLAAILTLPLVPLGIYGIYPSPFYDPDACLAVLVSVAAILAARGRSTTRARWVLAGALLTIPVFVKQNIGGTYLVVAVAALAAEALWRPSARASFRWCVVGLGGALALEGLILQLVVGIDNYLRWTLGFALSGRGLAAEKLAPFTDVRLLWPGLSILLLVLVSQRLPSRARGAIFVAALLAAIPAIALVPGLALAAPQFFPPVLTAASILAVIRVATDGPDFETLLPLVLTATTAGAVLSQGLGSSTYGIFSLLVLALAALVRLVGQYVDKPVRVASLTGVLLSVLLTLSGTSYVLTSTRLSFVDVNAAGEVTRSTFPSLAGLSAAGPYIADLDAMLFWARDNVAPDEPMVFLPGEDPAFFALGRPPRLPSVYFYDVANPYSPAEIVTFADVIGLRWVFVKDRLQLREEPPLNQALIAALTEDATLVARVSAYRIYRR